MERTFTYPHKEHIIDVTIWNETENPLVLYDFNNVLNAHTLEKLQSVARTKDKPYAIVSFLHTKGKNFIALKQRAQDTGECIVALTSKLKGNKKWIETGLKNKVINLMEWENVECAIDDKPHEWYDNKNSRSVKLRLNPQKKQVYLVKLNN